MIELRWRKTKEGERGFKFAPPEGSCEFVLQYRETVMHYDAEGRADRSASTDWVDVEINDE